MSALFSKEAQEIRDMWQSRALAAAGGKMRAVLTAVLAKEYHAAFTVMWRVTFGDQDVPDSFIAGYGKVFPSGRVVADVMGSDRVKRPAVIFASPEAYTGAMRRLADRLKLKDTERAEFFGILSKWIVADMRVGPHGQRLAS